MATLLSLPVELIRLISMALCPHCQVGPDLGQGNRQTFVGLEVWPDPAQWESHIGLVSLASTCRVLRNVALPISFHSPVVFTGVRIGDDTLGSSKAFPLVRTLLERPDRARYVQELNCFGWEGGPYDVEVSRDIAALFEAKMLDCLDSLPRFWRSRPGSAPGDLLLQLFQAMRGPRYFNMGDNGTRSLPDDYSYYLKAVALACVPNIRRLWIGDAACKLRVASLPFLEELVIRPIEGYTNEFLGSYESIFAGAPSLRAVWISGAQTNYLKHHPGVTELYLDVCSFSPSDMYDAISYFPSLKKFHYENGNLAGLDYINEQVNPVRAYDAVRQRGSTLEHLSLTMFLGDDQCYPRAEQIADMRDMSRLETLDLGGVIIDSEALNFRKEGLGIFPSTVRRLILRGMIKDWGPIRLFYMVKENRFPRLEELVVDATEELLEDEAMASIMAACNERRVKCEINYWIRSGVNGSIVEESQVTNAQLLAQGSGSPRQPTGPHTNMEQEVEEFMVG